MAKNRMHPYGYKIANGKTAIEPQEAEIIRRIYSQYAAGLSLKRIAEELTASGIYYMPEKPAWNKNMIARILQNKSYVGENLYPAIIEVAEQRSAELAQKPYTHTESQDIKNLKPLLVCAHCNEPIRRRIKTAGGERWYCPSDVKHISAALTDETLLKGIENLVQRLAKSPNVAKASSRKHNQIDLDTIRIQNEIDLALAQAEPDLAEIQQNILALAARKYAITLDANDDDGELEQVLGQLIGAPLNSTLLKSITAQIKVSSNQVATLILKNRKVIQPPMAEKGVHDHA